MKIKNKTEKKMKSEALRKKFQTLQFSQNHHRLKYRTEKILMHTLINYEKIFFFWASLKRENCSLLNV